MSCINMYIEGYVIKCNVCDEWFIDYTLNIFLTLKNKFTMLQECYCF